MVITESNISGKVKARFREQLDRSLYGLYMLHFYHRIRAAYQAKYSDEEFANRSHVKAVGSTLNLDNPVSFDERQWWLKLYYRNPLMITCTDKIAVRKYIESRGLGEILLPLLGVYSSPDEIDWDALPTPCYIKTNNSSGTNVRCNDRDAIDVSHVRKKLKVFLKRDHYAYSREWNYRSIQPKLMIEPVIEAGVHGLKDYRFYCSYGKCHAINVDLDTADENGRHREDSIGNFYDLEWNQIPVQVNAPSIRDQVISRPVRLQDMLQYAERLSEPFPFCRVDLYHLDDGRIIFGEMTFFNRGGNNVIEPKSFEALLGSWVASPREGFQ